MPRKSHQINKPKHKIIRQSEQPPYINILAFSCGHTIKLSVYRLLFLFCHSILLGVATFQLRANSIHQLGWTLHIGFITIPLPYPVILSVTFVLGVTYPLYLTDRYLIHRLPGSKVLIPGSKVLIPTASSNHASNTENNNSESLLDVTETIEMMESAIDNLTRMICTVFFLFITLTRDNKRWDFI
jgi:hypothetical protein